MSVGWGTVFGRIADMIPGREERIRTLIRKLKRERDEILKNNIPDNKRDRFNAVLKQLREIEAKLQDSV